MTTASPSRDPRHELADATGRPGQARQRVADIEQARQDAWDDALDQVDDQLRHLAITLGAEITDDIRYNEVTVTLAGQVSVHLLGGWPDRGQGLRITTPAGLEAEFSGHGAPPPAAAVIALVRALLEPAAQPG
jgi:hypothetical protein